VTERAESAVGRIDRATGFRPEVDLTELDTKRTLSRRHARILKRGDDFYVCEEKGAHNGTFVNGERLATGAEAKLVDGARVRFGLVELVFRRR
jgi:pSer/pThr/pTyr-binding forkhead associated (FHA) protein